MTISPPATPASVRPMVVLVAYTLAQVGVILFGANGLAGDEGIYALAGCKILAGEPQDYVKWVNGSLYVWPVLAGLAWKAGGLVACRLLALGFALVVLACAGRLAARLAGPAAAGWAMLSLAANGMFFALAHLAVYDLPALAGFAVAVVCLVENRDMADHRRLVGAAGAMAFSIIAKYGYGFLLPVVFGLIAVSRNGRSRMAQAASFALIVGGLVMAHDLVAMGHVLPVTFGAYATAGASLSRTNAAWQQLYYALPLVLAAVALGRWRKERRESFEVAVLLFAALLIWPAFHLWTGNPVSANKHTVAGAFCAAPLVGAILARPGRWRRLGLVAYLVWGGVQWFTHEFSWRDFTPAARYVSEHARPGQAIYANDGFHRLLPYFYTAGLLTRPQAEPISALEEPGTYPRDAVWVVWAEPDRSAQAEVQRRGIEGDFTEVFGFRTIYVGENEGVIGIHRCPIRVFRRKAAPDP